MKVLRRPIWSDALLYEEGVDHPFVVLNQEGHAVINPGPNETRVFAGNWIVREKNSFDIVFTDEEEFRRQFVTGDRWLGTLDQGSVAVKDFFAQASEQASGIDGPLTISVSSWTHGGKTMIGSVIESMLRGFGFKDVTVHQPEEPQHVREEKMGQLIEMQDEPSAQSFFNKPIRIFEVNAGFPKSFKKPAPEKT